MSHKEIWQKLAAVDCSKHVEQKGNLSYLSWAWAWGILMDHYPEATFKVHKDKYGRDGSVECKITVTIGECSRTMWLPVMDNRNNAVENPNMRQISDTRMRCLVKCLSLFGLAHYLYAGEDLPQVPSFTAEQKGRFLTYLANGDGFGLKTFAHEVGNDTMSGLFNDAPQGQKTRLKDEVRKLVNEANAALKVSLAAIDEAIADGSYSAIEEIYSEMGADEAVFVDAALTEIQKHQIKTMREAA